MSTDKRQTDTQGKHNIPPPTSFAAGIKISYTAMMCAFVLNFSGFLKVVMADQISKLLIPRNGRYKSYLM